MAFSDPGFFLRSWLHDEEARQQTERDEKRRRRLERNARKAKAGATVAQTAKKMQHWRAKFVDADSMPVPEVQGS